MTTRGYTVNFWRTVQLFLTEDYIAEVEVHSATKEIRCNCPVSKKRKSCSHIKYVKAEMKNSDGNYTIKIPTHVDEDLVEMALEDAEMFRQFIIDYGKVEVID
jgi:hypothetical protein